MGPDAVAAALARWIWVPDGATQVTTDDWVLIRYPDWAFTPLLLARFVPAGDPAEALDAALAEAGRLAPDLTTLAAVAGLDSPQGTEALFRARGGVLEEDTTVLACGLGDGPPDLGEPPSQVQVRWTTDLESALDHNASQREVFGSPAVTVERAATVAAETDARVREGRGGNAVALLDGRPVGTGGVEIDGTDARLYGGGVSPEVRGRGIYRALLRHRLTYARDHGATLALTRGRVETSAPILRRAGFEACGRERTYRLPLRPTSPAS